MLAESPEGWRAYVTVIDDAAFDGLTPDQVLDAITDDYHFGFLLIVDADAIHGDARAVLVVDLFEERGRSFLALLSQVQSVENNLSLANMDFSEFAESVERDGVFRGFDE